MIRGKVSNGDRQLTTLWHAWLGAGPSTCFAYHHVGKSTCESPGKLWSRQNSIFQGSRNVRHMLRRTVPFRAHLSAVLTPLTLWTPKPQSKVYFNVRLSRTLNLEHPRYDVVYPPSAWLRLGITSNTSAIPPYLFNSESRWGDRDTMSLSPLLPRDQ